MARQEQDREDILREARALVERAEIEVPGLAEPVVIGFRKLGSISFYFGADPVIQFNPEGELRRMYLHGFLIKAEWHQLVRLQRLRTGDEVELVAHPLDAAETAETIQLVRHYLSRVDAALDSGTARCLRQVPAESGVVERIRQWLADHRSRIVVAAGPEAGG